MNTVIYSTLFTKKNTFVTLLQTLEFIYSYPEMANILFYFCVLFSISCHQQIHAIENTNSTETLDTIIGNASTVERSGIFLNKVLVASLKPNAYQEFQKINVNVRNELHLLLNSTIELPSVIDYSKHRANLIKYFDHISTTYEEVLKILKENSTSFSKKIDVDALDDSLTGIYSTQANGEDTRRFFTENFKEPKEVFLNACRAKMSHIQLLDSLLAHTHIATAQYYTIKYLFATSAKKSNANQDAYRYLAKVQHYNLVARTFQAMMMKASRELWACNTQPAAKLMNLEREYYFVQNRAMSNFLYNRVVTGARLVVEGSFIFIQVQEAKVLHKGLIDKKTLRWVPLNKDNLLGYIMHGKHTLESVDLTEITNVPIGNVITGLQLRKSDFTKRIKLVAYSREYNHTSGSINKVQESSTMPSDSTDEFILENKNDVSVTAPEKELSISKNNQYVSFKVVEHKDKTQNMVPFIDTQKVESAHPTPLFGAGLYLKGQPGHEASLGLKLFTLNIQPFIEY